MHNIIFATEVDLVNQKRKVNFIFLKADTLQFAMQTAEMKMIMYYAEKKLCLDFLNKIQRRLSCFQCCFD